MNQRQQVTKADSKTVRHLQIARALRSIGQGIAVVDLTLYLKALHWSGAAIGGVLSAAGIVGAGLILAVGLLSDKMGRKPFLLIYEALTALSALTLTFTSNAFVLATLIIAAGFGRGQNGAAGPFTPAEQAWMSVHVPLKNRGRIFSINSALGFFGMAAGAVLAGANHLWQHMLPGPLSFRPLFFLMFVLSVICAFYIWTAPREERNGRTLAGAEKSRPAAAASQDAPAQSGAEDSPAAASNSAAGSAPDLLEERRTTRTENVNLAKLFSVNMLNGLAIGFIGPLISYWFSAKFGVSSAQIGVTLALSFVLTGTSSLISGELAQRYGMVKSVVWLRMAGILLTLLIPLLPSFWLVSAVYILRSAFNRGTQGARSALSTSLTRDHRRGFSVSMNALAVRLPSSLGPTLSGYILDMGAFSLPFYLTGALQLGSNLLYLWFFRGFDDSVREKKTLQSS